jgi:hypothetical protein
MPGSSGLSSSFVDEQADLWGVSASQSVSYSEEDSFISFECKQMIKRKIQQC